MKIRQFGIKRGDRGTLLAEDRIFTIIDGVGNEWTLADTEAGLHVMLDNVNDHVKFTTQIWVHPQSGNVVDLFPERRAS